MICPRDVKLCREKSAVKPAESWMKMKASGSEGTKYAEARIVKR